MMNAQWVTDKALWTALNSERKLYHETDTENVRDAALEEGLNLCNFMFDELWFKYTYPDGWDYECFEIMPEIPNVRRADGFLFFCPENKRWFAGYDFQNKDRGYYTGPTVPFSPSFSNRRDAEEWCREQWCKFIGKKYERKAVQPDLFGGNYE